ncbi:putative F-box/LRR-repeat protein At3g18150 [Rutidosis leptorrhynchoides]|uniref:putative F-box/LRR-repeat protein At3g18150 n=1 Tax=Rutidosis leptorrhynchoides TaxID=125765 RepID=UPI003A99EDEA
MFGDESPCDEVGDEKKNISPALLGKMYNPDYLQSAVKSYDCNITIPRGHVLRLPKELMLLLGLRSGKSVSCYNLARKKYKWRLKQENSRTKPNLSVTYGFQQFRKENRLKYGTTWTKQLVNGLINQIFSYFDTKNAIKTSILSSRWKNVWKSIPHLDFSTTDLTSLPKLSEYVTHVLSSRNNEIELSSVKLSFCGEVSQEFVKTILSYAFSHNVQKMTIICLSNVREFEFPLSLFISHSLKDLNLIGSFGHIGYAYSYTKITSSCVLLPLTTLHLEDVRFINKNPNEFSGIFSKCPNLNNLTLTHFDIYGFIAHTISHSQLSNLTLKYGNWNSIVNVVAPHLKDLTVVNCCGDLMISTPEISSLMYKSQNYFEFSADGLYSLEKVGFYMCCPGYFDFFAPKIIDVLQQFRNIKYLTLGLEIVEVLASSVQLVSNLPSPFANLMNLKIYPANLQSDEEGQKKITMPTEIKKYLLDASPSATFTIFSRQEVQAEVEALQNATSAQQKMVELEMLLEEDKSKCKASRICIDESNELMEWHEVNMNEQLFKEEKMSRIKNCWRDLGVQIRKGEFEISYIFSKLDTIEDIIKKLPTSKKKDRIQARFSSLRTEAYNVMEIIMDFMKFRCDEKQSCITLCLNELAIASQSSS